MAKNDWPGAARAVEGVRNLRPNVVVTVADRYETMATAMAAAYMNIPVAHVQGGEVSGSIDEKVRHAVTKLADLHFVATPQAAERVVRMGEDPEAVFVPAVHQSTWRARCSPSPSSTSIPWRSTAGSAPVRTSRTATSSSCSIRSRPSTNGRPGQICETLHAIHEAGLPTAWFLAERRRGLRGHVGDNRRVLPTRAAAEHPLLQRHGPLGLPPAALQQPVSGRQLERRHPRVRVPRRPCRQHRTATGGAGSRLQRRGCRATTGTMSARPSSAESPGGASPPAFSTETAGPGCASRNPWPPPPCASTRGFATDSNGVTVPAIRARGLGKRYHVASRARGLDTLRDVVAREVRNAFRRSDRNGRKGADHIWALRDVSFDIGCGDVVGIIGPNGAGKSTLLRILSRITEPTEGHVEIRGSLGRSSTSAPASTSSSPAARTSTSTAPSSA